MRKREKPDRPVYTTLAARVNNEEAKLLKEAAAADGVTISDYLRGAAMMAAVMDGHPEAIRYVGRKIFLRIAERAREATVYDGGLPLKAR